MDNELKLAYLIADALTKGKTVEEIARLQVTLQTISSLVAAELACLRNGGSGPSQSDSGK